jgi:hypothetical protein
MNDEETLQKAIASLRQLNSEILGVPEHSRSASDKFAFSVIPTILPILRVVLKMTQIDSTITRSSSDYRHELNLAQSIISTTKQEKIDYTIVSPTELENED